MGIDRKDVRIVCHFNIPKSMEAFYQESGRAGRDQLPSRSVLYYGMDDCKRMKFILSSAESKKFQSSNLQDASSKKSLADFSQMVEYCEETHCRRKKILGSFGEEVPASFCRKSCDACKHPNLVAKTLEELSMACSFRGKNACNRVYINSSLNMIDDNQFSEFWNRDDGTSGSEEDISDDDDGTEVAKSLLQSSLPNSRLNEKMELLERAEESYYQNQIPEKQANTLNKNGVSDTLRESSKQRLLNALKQSQQRLGDLEIDYETSALFLENECHKKYGKSGKSFYLSQMVSTVRWLATANSVELVSRLGTFPIPTSEDPTPKANSSMALLDEASSNEEIHESEKPLSTLQAISQDEKLPAIPSFSEFVNRKKAKEIWSSDNSTQRVQKKMRHD